MNITPKPIGVKSLGKYKIDISFSDGKNGILDLSDLSGKGVFIDWENHDLFEKVFINPESNAIAWNEELEICPVNAYRKINSVNI